MANHSPRIEAAGRARTTPGADWATRIHVDEENGVVGFAHAATVVQTRPEDPAEMMAAFLRGAEARGTLPISEAARADSTNVRTLARSVTDPLAATSLAALMFEGATVAAVTIGSARIFLSRDGEIELLNAYRDLPELVSGDALTLCTPSIWHSVTPATLDQMMGRSKTASETLDSLERFVSSAVRYAVIVVKVH